MNPEITLSDVSLDFPIYGSPSSTSGRPGLKTLIGGVARRVNRHHVAVRALDEINLHLPGGSRYALIGPNGAGKSTILRVMSGIYHPTGGTASISGRVSTIFDLNAGADPNLTGYQNIWRVGYLHGMTRAQIEEKLEEIIDFAELGEFLDMPNRVYSSGMLTRLAFAICTMSQPDILLIDETFGTGDSSFREKAEKRITRMIEDSKILVFASHSRGILERFCTHGILMSRGRIEMIDDLATVLDCHEERQRKVAEAQRNAESSVHD
mgnify:CR=1 FL=1|tara:strand:- start:860 stop:1657 length:798 start_codon:yes stop_codon:yes gene_type:complete